MKFSCSRCNTRYSIADERVRGKILKIRCKNCSAVITVKEQTSAESAPVAAKAPAKKATLPRPRRTSQVSTASKGRVGAGAAASAPAAAKKPAGSVLSDAFAKAMTTEADPSASGSLASQAVSVDVDWYVAEGGVQSGPFRIDKAREWVAARPASVELYCWADGFGDWRRVDEVSQFADVDRKAPGFADAAPTAIQPGAVAGAAAAKPNHGMVDLIKPRRPDSGLDLEIGEVSRVVRIPFVPLDRERAKRPSGAALPGLAPSVAARIGTGTGAVPSFGQTGGLPVRKPAHSRGFWALVGGLSAAVVAMAGMLLYLSMDSGEEGPALRRSQVAGNELGYRLGDVKGQGKPMDFEDPVDVSRGSGGKRANTRKVATTGRKPTVGRPRKGTTSPTEVDLENTEGDAAELSPDDVLEKYRKSGFAINRCYERAKKRDPFLEIKRAKVKVSIDMQGRASASIPSIQNQPLRRCLEATIRGWRFRKPKEPFRAELTMLFKDR